MEPISAEKRTALLLRHSRLHRLTVLLRCLEALALSAAVLWSSARIPSAAAASGDLLRRLLPVVLGPRFLFLLGNAIVLTLLFKSRRLPSSPGGDAGDFTAEISISAFAPPPQPPPRTEEVVFEDKRVTYCVEERAQAPEARVCRRSRSERVRERRREPPELRRSETEVGKKKKKGEEDAEEFRRTIEAFIERQLKFQREESMAMVVCSAGTAEQHKQVTA